MTPHNAPVPAVVTEFANDIRDHTGITPTITKTRPTCWQVIASNDRVHSVTEIKIAMIGGSVKRRSGSLTIDGMHYQHACCGRHLQNTIDNPAPPAEPATPDPIPDDGDVAEAPMVVQRRYQMLATLWPKDTGGPRVGRISPDLWVLGMDLPPYGAARVFFRRRRMNRWAVDKHRPVQFISDGVDLSASLGTGLRAVRKMLFAMLDSPTPAAPATVGRAETTKRDNGVEARHPDPAG